MFRTSNKTSVSLFPSRTNGKTLFSKNAGVGASVAAVFDPELKSIYLELVVLSKLYAEGKFTQLRTQLTNDKYALLTVSLGRLRSSNTEFEMIRSSSLSFLQGLQRAYLQNIELTNTKLSYSIVKDRADILDDMDRLREFLIELNSRTNSSVFGEYAVTASVSAVVAPQYLVYIEKYGFPPEGIFDSEKLASINIKSGT